jgi:hypothetical protein
MSDLLACAAWTARRRHYAEALPDGIGDALCGERGASQARLDAEYARCGVKPPKRFADLPVCRRCEKKAGDRATVPIEGHRDEAEVHRRERHGVAR